MYIYKKILNNIKQLIFIFKLLNNLLKSDQNSYEKNNINLFIYFKINEDNFNPLLTFYQF